MKTIGRNIANATELNNMAQKLEKSDAQNALVNTMLENKNLN